MGIFDWFKNEEIHNYKCTHCKKDFNNEEHAKKHLELCIYRNLEKEIVILPSEWGTDKKIIFTNTFLEYEDKIVNYSDIRAISYMATSRSINFIPIGTAYEFIISYKIGNISLSLDEKTWLRFIDISKNVIEPILIKRIITKIFDENMEINIGEIKFNKRGYSKNKFFGGKEEVLWSDTTPVPRYISGEVRVYNKDGGIFSRIPMIEDNSVILPELIETCHYYNQIINNDDN